MLTKTYYNLNKDQVFLKSKDIELVMNNKVNFNLLDYFIKNTIFGKLAKLNLYSNIFNIDRPIDIPKLLKLDEIYKISTSEDKLVQFLDKSPIYKYIRFLNKNLISENTSNRLFIEDTIKNFSFISEFKIINFDFIKDMEKLVSSTFDVSSLPDYYKVK
jgi:hypothetical protein